MVSKIKETKPDLVIVGVGHSEEIAPEFSLADYIAFHHDLWGNYFALRNKRAHKVIRLKR